MSQPLPSITADKLQILWNPKAGPQERNAASLAQIQSEHGDQVQVHVTESEEHSAELTKHVIAQGARHIAAAGGDGVINVVAEAILRSWPKRCLTRSVAIRHRQRLRPFVGLAAVGGRGFALMRSTPPLPCSMCLNSEARLHCGDLA